MCAFLVYAVCLPTARQLDLAGIAGEPLALCRAARLAAVIGARRRPPPASEGVLRRYDAVVRALALELPAVLPARFGTCVDSLEELALVLRSRDETLRSALRQVRGRVQMTLRSVAPQRPRAPLPAGGTRNRGSGRAYLQSLAAQAAREREVTALAPVMAAVGRWVRAERVDRSGRVASVYHLIPRGSVAAYSSAAQRAAHEAGVAMVLSGPFPPYAFGAA